MIKQILQAFKNAFRGIPTLWLELNFRIEIIWTIFLFTILIISGNVISLLVLTPMHFLLFSAEAFNTAIEKTVDLDAGDQRIVLAGMAKDISAAAVMFVALAVIFLDLFVIYGSFIKGMINV